MMRQIIERIIPGAKAVEFVDKIIRYHPIYYRRAQYVIDSFKQLNLEARREASDRLLHRVLVKAAQTEYGKPFGTEIENWPVLEKSRLRDGPMALFTRGFARLPAQTGGTTGVPIRLWRSIENIAAEQAFIDDILIPHGITFRTARIAVLRADYVKDPTDPRPPFGALRFDGRRLILSNPHLSHKTVNWFVDALKKFRPDIFWVYPSMLSHLLHLMKDAGLTLRVPLVLSSSEVLSIHTRKAIENILSASLIDYYGQAERVGFAFSHKPDEYWFSPAYGRIELAPGDDDKARNGPHLAHVIATGYWNHAMPLVRFATGDHVVLPAGASSEDLAAIILGTKPFPGIAGRTNEFIVTAEGQRIGGLNHLPRGVENILQLQVVQEDIDRVVLNVLAQDGFGEADRRMLLQNARAKIPENVTIAIETVDRLEYESSGKQPFVIRRPGSQECL